MKRIVIAFLNLYLVFTLQIKAQENDWTTVSIPGICTFQIPPTLEIQAGMYKQINEKLISIICKDLLSDTIVIAQPKGINSGDPDALKRFCRVMVDTTYGSPGSYGDIDSPIKLSKEEAQEIDELFKQSTALFDLKGMKWNLLSSQPVKIVKINDVYAIKNTSVRTVNDGPPAIQHTYMFQNNDCLHTVTILYRFLEMDLWAEDLEKVIYTFKFNKR